MLQRRDQSRHSISHIAKGGNVMTEARYRSDHESSGSIIRVFSAACLFASIAAAIPARAEGPSSAQSPKPTSCADLAKLSLPRTTITSATVLPAGPFANASVGDPLAAQGTTSPLPTCSSNIASPQLPTFCRVTGAIATPDAAEPISIEIWLPLDHWNGKFEAVGNHGFAGEIGYADMGPELVKGYAVATTDTGHAGAAATAWMQNHQQIVNYGSLGVHEMTIKSKAIVKAFYGKAPKYSYFNGCSTGGKEGLMEAQRYPADYDGINVGGSANFAQIHNRVEYVWNGQVTFGNAATPITAATAALVNAAAVAACDGLDGVVDGVIDDPLICSFKPASLVCKPGQDPGTCLTAAQAEAVEKVYDGPRNPRTNEEIYPGLARGTERGWGSGTTGPGVSTADTFFKFMVYNDPNWNFETFQFDHDLIAADAKFSPLIDAIDPDLSAFRRHGGKILQSHLWSSVVHPAARSIEYYEQVVTLMNHGEKHLDSRDFDETQEFYRLFMAPGGAGSKGPGSFDSLPYLERWVEQGIAPDSIIASHVTGSVVDRTRPLCAYPAVEAYKGSGSIDDAENFTCREPRQVVNYFVKDGPEMDDPTTHRDHDDHAFNSDDDGRH
jgi:feruloyl esterase